MDQPTAVPLDPVEPRELAESVRRHLASIVNTTDDAIISKSLDGVILSWNDAATRLFGYSADQAIGRHISFLIPPEREGEEDRILAKLRAGERILHFDTVRQRSDGRLVHVSVTISPVRDQTGRVVGASKIARDITDRKRAEQQIYDLLTQLKDADRAKDEFLATLAHELRGPLAPLAFVAEILKNEGDPEALARARETLERQLGLLVRLVDDLLDVSRITTHKLELRTETSLLQNAIRQAVELCRPLAEAARHDLVVDLPAEPIYLEADPARLVQVFGNLLNNACRYTEEAGTIRLSVTREGGFAVVRVSDDGIGIEAEELPFVFDIFSQARRANGTARGGLGLGLAIVRRLVEMHGGTIAVTSPGRGRGSTFSVRLPVVVEAATPSNAGRAAPSAPAGGGRRILVVDDDVDSATSLSMLLKIQGHETEMAHDGLAAVQAAETFRPHVVLLDISLPKFDGHEAARRIRALPGGTEVMLIALTGWAQEEDRKRSKAAGFDDHLLKPVDLKALLQRLSPT